MSDWQILIKRYAGEREICNCEDAYLTNCGTGIAAGETAVRHDLPCCKGGCGSNQITAKEYIAGRVLEDLERADNE